MLLLVASWGARCPLGMPAFPLPLFEDVGKVGHGQAGGLEIGEQLWRVYALRAGVGAKRNQRERTYKRITP